jgi:glucose-1-phosphate adenylyltransferase
MISPAIDTLAVVLAGGRGSRLGPLTAEECKPALPFGRGRNIDFSLSNCINSGIRRVGVATQYRPESLVHHIETEWRVIAERHAARVENWPASACAPGEGYGGTADAVFRNWGRIEAVKPRHVLVLAGDHVYKMDYRALLERHLETGADATIGCVEVDLDDASQFGILSVDGDGRVVRFTEKPSRLEPDVPGSRRALASMGIYVFATDALQRVLAEDAASATSSHDFGHDIIPKLARTARLFGHVFRADSVVGGGYWRDIGTLTAYWQAQLELLDPDSVLRRTQAQWPILTWPAPEAACCASAARRKAHCRDALVGPDCEFDDAFIVRSVLCQGVRVGPHACVRDSVVLPGATIGKACYLDRAIVAPGCVVPDGTVIGQPTILRAGRARLAATPILVTPEWCAAQNRWERVRAQAVQDDRLYA